MQRTPPRGWPTNNMNLSGQRPPAPSTVRNQYPYVAGPLGESPLLNFQNVTPGQHPLVAPSVSQKREISPSAPTGNVHNRPRVDDSENSPAAFVDVESTESPSPLPTAGSTTDQAEIRGRPKCYKFSQWC